MSTPLNIAGQLPTIGSNTPQPTVPVELLADGLGGTTPYPSAAVDTGNGTAAKQVVSASATVAVAAGAGTTHAKNGKGFLCRAVITTAGTTGNLTIYDNTAGSGLVIGVVPGTTADSNALLGRVYDFSMPAAIGITAVGASGSPGVTLSVI